MHNPLSAEGFVQKIRILQIENEPQLAEMAQAALETLGYLVVQTFASGEEALEHFESLHPDLVLMDINLDGDLDGIQTAERMQKRVNVPVIFLSALHDDPTLDRAKRSNPLAYLVKPVQIPLLHAAIEMALYKHRRDSEREELLEKTVGGSIKMLTEILAAIEPLSFGQAQQLRQHMLTMATILKGDPPWEFEVAALLANIGFVLIPASIVQKLRHGIAFTHVESSLLLRVPEFGRDLLLRIPHLESVAEIVYYQNKDFDGSGFPHDQIAADKLPLGARLLRILMDVVKFQSERGSTSQLVDRLKSYPGRYDRELLKLVIQHIVDAPPKGAAAIHLKELKPGQTLKAAIETHDGTVLVAAGNVITPFLLDKLRNFVEINGIREPIYVEDNPKKGDPDAVSADV